MIVDQTTITSNVKTALLEDMGQGDITATLIPEQTTASATVICREQAILAGTAWFDEVFHQLDTNIDIKWHTTDKERITPNQLVAEITGLARPILTGERTALNFLQTLSGTATSVAEYIELIKDTPCKILDTRKTIPGLRLAQKYAVSCGGGINHRLGLYDAILIKENHILAAGSIHNAVTQAKQTGLPIEVEVESMTELEQALAAKADQILLDNFSLDDLEQAVSIRTRQSKFEASGNIDKDTLRAVAETGVDYISIGALTKHLHAIDFSMRVETGSG